MLIDVRLDWLRKFSSKKKTLNNANSSSCQWMIHLPKDSKIFDSYTKNYLPHLLTFAAIWLILWELSIFWVLCLHRFYRAVQILCKELSSALICKCITNSYNISGKIHLYFLLKQLVIMLNEPSTLILCVHLLTVLLWSSCGMKF